MDHIRFPIGQFEPQIFLSHDQRIQIINQLPAIILTLRTITQNLNQDRLHTPYRQDGWTIQQIVHHLADNDMNAYLRFKKALTEEEPMSSSYQENLWAELNDYKDVPIEISLTLIEALHTRFHILLSGLDPKDYSRKLKTAVLGSITLDIALQRFIWHNHHHIAHIKSVLEKSV